MSNAEIICADKRMIEFADAQKKKLQCSHSVDGVVYICSVAVEHSVVLHLLSGFLLQYNKKPFSVYTLSLHQVEDCAHTITIIGGHRVC